jgi:hypothetical protein
VLFRGRKEAQKFFFSVNEEVDESSSEDEDDADDVSIFEDDFKQKVISSPSSKNLLKLAGSPSRDN